MATLLAEYKYFRVEELPQENRRKTRDYSIISTSSNNLLGHISFYPSWRQHVFVPEPNTIWSVGCLEDINDAIKTIKGRQP